MRKLAALAATLALAIACTPPRVAEAPTVTQPSAPPAVGPTGDEPPPAPREFRAAWVATVANIDWPTRRDLGVAQQRAEMVAILERSRALNFNVIVLQVRPSADAIYPSALEPWSEYLTGEQGRAPNPLYDPLQEWIEAAHARGIEIHAWFNPYRARHNKAVSPSVPTHISRTHPAVVKAYGDYLWMDPGEPFAAQRTLDVILDVVRRYDVDGVHIDDYFYPYPIKAPGLADVEIDFPDGPSWGAYQARGGTLDRAAWRRQNVDALIERIYAAVHKEKAWVRFGVSPFGIGKPALRPAGIAGFSQYDKLYADVELWMQRCWLDYLVPQLYWPRAQAPQAFGVLLDYWIAQNTCKRHIVAGLYTSRINDTPQTWSVDEIAGQIDESRRRAGNVGHVHFSMAALSQNRAGLSDQLAATRYASQALIPTSPWIDTTAPAAPDVAINVLANGNVEFEAAARPGKPVARWAVWARSGGIWRFTSHPAKPNRHTLVPAAGTTIDRVVVTAVDRLGNESRRVTLEIPFSASAVEAGIVPVARWGGTAPDASRARAHTIKRLTLHHQGETYPPGRDPREYLRALQKWSREAKGWVDIPYHYVIDLQGRIYEARPLGLAGDTNTEYDPAGHALVQVVGNFEEVEPTPGQLEAVVRVMTWLALRHGLTERDISGHKDHSKTTVCPGRNLDRYLENGWIRERVRANLAAAGR